MRGLKRQLKASTLIEVLVAMTIILACAGIGMTAVSNLSRDMNADLKIQAEIYMDKITNDTWTESDFTDKNFEFSAFRVERTIQPYNKQKRLRLLTIEAYTLSNRKVGERKQLILVMP